jgi:hypothetical protein
MINKINKKAQEEMVGFAVIIIIVSVIILVFLGFSLRQKNPEISESYEIQSFLQVVLQQTITQENVITDLREMIKDCDRYDLNCNKLELELKNILDNSWNVNEESKIKGYLLKIYSIDKEILVIKEGNETKNYRTGSQDLVDKMIISLRIYN